MTHSLLRSPVSAKGQAVGAAATALLLVWSSIALADPFTTPGGYEGRISAQGANRSPIFAGSKAEIEAQGLAPNQPVSLRQAGEVLGNGASFAADDKGNLKAELEIPATAKAGLYPVVAELGGDTPSATVFDLKVSKQLPFSGSENYALKSVEIVRNPYQIAVGKDAIYVTGAVGRPPVKESELAKIDPQSMEITARVTPQAAPSKGDREGGVFAVYGIGLDEQDHQVWVTNSRQNTVAVYDSKDLSLIKQFPEDSVDHPRDVLLANGKAYVSATFTPEIYVFDAKHLDAEPAVIEIPSSQRGQRFAAASLSLAPEANELFVSSLGSNEVAVIDLKDDSVKATWKVPHSVSTIGVAASADGSRVYTVAQGNDAVSILDGKTGALIKQVNIGANPLNTVVEPKSGNIFVALRGAHAVAVISPEGELLANLDVGSTPNHLTQDGAGNVYVVNKSGGEDDPTANRLTRISAK
ncbi:ATP-binding protein [Thioclava sp. GXIMD4215]|uniref:ATP-binding protein n=1 Tax=Thioclava sp. GXIMD4215 TaxID=3131928 RepID=UPI00311B07BF